MAYSTSSPPTAVGPGISSAMTLWTYKSADSVATVIAADYFSNGHALGMKVGDCVFIYDTNVGDGAIAFVTAVTAGGAASAAEYQAVTT